MVVADVFGRVDTDNNGRIDYQEFKAFLFTSGVLSVGTKKSKQVPGGLFGTVMEAE